MAVKGGIPAKPAGGWGGGGSVVAPGVAAGIGAGLPSAYGERMLSPRMAALKGKFPYLSDAALEALASMETYTDPKIGEFVYSQEGTKIPISEVAMVFSQPGWTPYQFLKMAGEKTTWGQVAEPVTGELTGERQATTAPTSKTVRGVNPETGEPWTHTHYDLGSLGTYYRMKTYFTEQGKPAPSYVELWKPTPEYPLGKPEAMWQVVAGKLGTGKGEQETEEEYRKRMLAESYKAPYSMKKAPLRTSQFAPPTRWLMY